VTAAQPSGPKTAAVVLAAGGGTRFEGTTHKLLAPFHGRPLVCWAVDHALASNIGPLAVVTGAVDLATILPPGITVLANPRWAEGQATSLRAALTWADQIAVDAVVIGLGDQPLIPASAWIAVASARAPIATANFAGLRCPPVRLHRSVWALTPDTGDSGARTVMERFPHLVSDVVCSGDPFDVDTAADLAPPPP